MRSVNVQHAWGIKRIKHLILDLYSRKVVGFEVHDTDSAEHTAHLARRTALAEGLHTMSARPVLHGDNGATLKATTVLAMLHWLGIKPFVYDLDSVEFVEGDGGIRQVLSDALGEGRAHIDADLADRSR